MPSFGDEAMQQPRGQEGRGVAASGLRFFEARDPGMVRLTRRFLLRRIVDQGGWLGQSTQFGLIGDRYVLTIEEDAIGL